MKKRIIIAVGIALVVILAVVTAVAMSKSKTVSADEVRHDKRITTSRGETVELDYSGTEEKLDGSLAEKYTDQIGNSYMFNEEGTNTSYYANLEKYKDLYYRYQNGEFERIDEKTAIETASAELSSRYGEYFDSMQLIKTTYAEGDGIWIVGYAQLIGEDDAIEGIVCHASVLPDGTIGSYAISGVPEFEGIGDEQVKGITYDMISHDVENTLVAKYGDSLLSYDIDRIWLRNENGRVVVAAAVRALFLSEEGKEIPEEWPLFTYELND